MKTFVLVKSAAALGVLGLFAAVGALNLGVQSSQARESNYKFIGCRHSVGECFMSCPTRGTARAIKDDKKCDIGFEPNSDSIGCYCRY